MSDKIATTVQIKGFPLIKFQSAENIKQLQQGNVYMKNLEWLRQHETNSGDCVVGDLFEASLHFNEAKLIIPELGKEIDIKDGLMPTSYSFDFVFCMFGINPDSHIFEFTNEQKKEIANFGDTALLITDKDEYFHRMFIAIEKAGLKGYHGFVEYYDEHIDSVNLFAKLIKGMEKIAFLKRDKYRYQQEYRFLIHMDKATEDHIELNIGDISDISRVMKTSTILNSMAIQHETENS